jgi:hypothetical protein
MKMSNYARKKYYFCDECANMDEETEKNADSMLMYTKYMRQTVKRASIISALRRRTLNVFLNRQAQIFDRKSQRRRFFFVILGLD